VYNIVIHDCTDVSIHDDNNSSTESHSVHTLPYKTFPYPGFQIDLRIHREHAVLSHSRARRCTRTPTPTTILAHVATPPSPSLLPNRTNCDYLRANLRQESLEMMRRDPSRNVTTLRLIPSTELQREESDVEGWEPIDDGLWKPIQTTITNLACKTGTWPGPCAGISRSDRRSAQRIAKQIGTRRAQSKISYAMEVLNGMHNGL
jgi:hypothetical protein